MCSTSSCACGFPKETTAHFFFDWDRYAAIRDTLLTSSALLLGARWSSAARGTRIKWLLYGLPDVSFEINVNLFRPKFYCWFGSFSPGQRLILLLDACVCIRPKICFLALLFVNMLMDNALSISPLAFGAIANFFSFFLNKYCLNQIFRWLLMSCHLNGRDWRSLRL